jgi:hypothetical protein
MEANWVKSGDGEKEAVMWRIEDDLLPHIA